MIWHSEAIPYADEVLGFSATGSMDEAAFDSTALSRRLVILAFLRKGVIGSSNMHSGFSIGLSAATLGVILLLTLPMLSGLSDGLDNGGSFVFDGKDNGCIAAPLGDDIYV